MSEWSRFAGVGSPTQDADPLPEEAVRDLLGLARALFVARRDAGAGRAELERLALAGRRLRHALKLALSKGPNDLVVAWWQAEQAVADLAPSIEQVPPGELFDAARRRLRA